MTATTTHVEVLTELQRKHRLTARAYSEVGAGNRRILSRFSTEDAAYTAAIRAINLLAQVRLCAWTYGDGDIHGTLVPYCLRIPPELWTQLQEWP